MDGNFSKPNRKDQAKASYQILEIMKDIESYRVTLYEKLNNSLLTPYQHIECKAKFIYIDNLLDDLRDRLSHVYSLENADK